MAPSHNVLRPLILMRLLAKERERIFVLGNILLRTIIPSSSISQLSRNKYIKSVLVRILTIWFKPASPILLQDRLNSVIFE